MKRNPELRVKIKSLAEEARIIRKDETAAYDKGDYFTGNRLHTHRVIIVRREVRATLLAYQYLRGIPYAVCEGNNRKTFPNWKSVGRMIKKYGGQPFDQKEWRGGKNFVAPAPLTLPEEPAAA